MIDDIGVLKHLNEDEIKARASLNRDWVITEPEVSKAWNLEKVPQSHPSREFKSDAFRMLADCAEENITTPDNIPDFPSYLPEHARGRWRLIYLHREVPVLHILNAPEKVLTRLAVFLDGKPLCDPVEMLSLSAAKPLSGYALIDFKMRRIKDWKNQERSLRLNLARRLSLPDFIQACMSFLLVKHKFPLPAGPTYHWALNHESGLRAFARIRRGALRDPDFLEVRFYHKKKPAIRNRGMIVYRMCTSHS